MLPSGVGRRQAREWKALALGLCTAELCRSASRFDYCYLLESHWKNGCLLRVAYCDLPHFFPKNDIMLLWGPAAAGFGFFALAAPELAPFFAPALHGRAY